MRTGIFSSLRFDIPAIEASFRSHDCRATVPVARFCYFTGCFLWAGFGVVDILLAPDRLGVLWAIRFGVGLPTLALAYLATYSPALQSRLKLIGVAVTLICGASIVGMTAVLDSPVADSYYVGLILVLFSSYIFAQLRFFQAMVSGLGLLALYEAILVLHHDASLSTVINNSAFVISTIYIGLFACLKLEQHRRVEFTDKQTIESDNHRLTQLTSDLEYKSSHDVLTDLLNRRQLASVFEDAVSRSAKDRQATAVMLIDVDRFKQINDQHGHEVGDEVLKQVAQAIRGNLYNGASAFRYGGDEFLVLLPGRSAVGSAAIATRIATSFRDWLGVSVTSAGAEVGVSIGVTEVVSPLDALRDVMRLADAAMYEAKRRGRGRIVIQPRSSERTPEPGVEPQTPQPADPADRDARQPIDRTGTRPRRL
jgi:diguanylate cyclase (GGDEF)-like protein